MRNLIQRIYISPNYSKIYSWGRLIAIAGTAQVLVQVASLICGILIIRLLPTEEYALYTIANTMVGTMSVLADGGISAGVMSIGGKVWQNPKSLGAVLYTGLRLRQRFAIGSLLIAIPILIYLLQYHGASWLSTALIVFSIIPTFYAALSDSLLETVPKLQQDIKPLQKNQVIVSLLRLLFNCLLLFVFPWSFVAIISNGIPRAIGNIRLKKIAGKFVEKQAPDKEINQEILIVVKRILPGAIYYCFVGQISIWLISIFGNKSSIAQVGALSRLGMVISVFSVIASTLVVPRFAKLPPNKKMVITRFVQIMIILLIGCSILVGAALIFPEQILYILGNQYAGLQTELVLSIIVSCLGLIGGIIHSLNIVRRFIMLPAINIGVHFISQIILIIFMKLSSTQNVLIFSIVDNLIIIFILLLNFMYYVIPISRWNESK